jgi:hypothetical protein
MRGIPVQPDSKILVPGETSPAAGAGSLVARLLDDETRDSTLRGEGLVSLASSGATDEINGLPIRPVARIVTVGTSSIGTTWNPIDDEPVVRDLGDSGSYGWITAVFIRERL